MVSVRVLRALGLAVPLGVGAVLMCIGIARPWTGSYDANGALYGTAARNYLRHGIVATRGGQVCNAGALVPSEFHFYAHHPPGVSMAIAVSFAVFGAHEWSARLPFVGFTLGAIGLVFHVARLLGGRVAGFFAAFLFAVQPMVAFYGRMPDHEAPAAFFALAQAACYLQWRADGQRRWLTLGSVAAFVGVWFAWVAVLMPFLLLGVEWLTRRRRQGEKTPAVFCRNGPPGASHKRQRVSFPLLGVAAGVVGFVTVLGHVALVEGGLGELWRVLVTRVGSQMASEGGRMTSFGLPEFLGRHWTYFTTAFSGVVACVSLVWLAGVRVRGRLQGWLVAGLGAFALFNIVAFRQGSFEHIYYQYYLAAPLALMAGAALAELCRGKRLVWHLLAFWVAAVAGLEGWTKLSAIRGKESYLDQMSVVPTLSNMVKREEQVVIMYEGRRSLRQLAYYADRNFVQVRSLGDIGFLAAPRWLRVRPSGVHTRILRLVQVNEREMRIEEASAPK